MSAQRGLVSPVSIHARHYWRARRSRPKPNSHRLCFNPRPPLLAGETEHTHRKREAVLVSIHARHYWRARPARLVLRPNIPPVSIHARHYWRARRYPDRVAAMVGVFQSTPAITGGRDNESRHMRATDRRFNPRPPLLAGETTKRRTPQAQHHVSIHARHYWRARRSTPPADHDRD